MEKYFHIPVMIEEVLKYLNLKKGSFCFDGTLGGASYSKKISEAIGENALLISTDLDPLAISNFSKLKNKNTLLFNENFSNIKNIVLENKINKKFDAMVLDLGLSSAQLSDNSRGFSFLSDTDLNMAFGPKSENSTYWIVNNYRQDELEKIIKEYGEESWAKRIAQNIVNYRKNKKIEKTGELANIISSSIPRKFWSKRIHPATKTFQALRIETNQELESLKIFLSSSVDLLKKGGRLVIVSFHSLEDRIVKNFFRDLSKGEEAVFKILTKKPLIAGDQELKENARARSAKLRAVEKI